MNDNNTKPTYRNSDLFSPARLPLGIRLILFIVLLCLLIISIFIMARYYDDPTLASPKELGVPFLFLFSLVGLGLLLIPWHDLGLSIKKIGAVEFEQIVLTQKKEYDEAIDYLSKKIEDLQSNSNRMSVTRGGLKPEDELDKLLIQFLKKNPHTSFSAWKIQSCSSDQSEFKQLGKYSKTMIQNVLNRLHAQGELEITLSRKGNTLYRLAEHE